MSCPCCTSASNDFFVDAWVRDGGVIVIIYGMIVCLWGLGGSTYQNFLPLMIHYTFIFYNQRFAIASLYRA